MLHPAEVDQPFLQPPVDQAAVPRGPAEELPPLPRGGFGVGEGDAGVSARCSAAAFFAKARRARACASSEDTFGCNERMRRWFFA